MEYGHPIISCDCDEKYSTVNRSIYGPVILTPQILDRLWKSFGKFKTIFGQDINRDYNKFVNLFVSQDGDTLIGNGLVWIIDDCVGIYYLSNIIQQGDKLMDANVHYAFFDSRYRGRQLLTKRMIRHVFDRYEFRRLSVELPLYTDKLFPDPKDETGNGYIADNPTRKFVESLGFKEEGRKQVAVEHNGWLYDAYMYGMINPAFIRMSSTLNKEYLLSKDSATLNGDPVSVIEEENGRIEN